MVTQSGNVVNITTNGQCISIPENTNFCEPPAQPELTGVSVLDSINITSSQTKGITIDLPGIPNPIDSIANAFSARTINAPSERATVNMDVCFDVTNQFLDIPGGFGITIDPPVTFAMVGTTTAQVVPDCFTTDATVINDAFTGETWVKGASGNFISTGF